MKINCPDSNALLSWFGTSASFSSVDSPQKSFSLNARVQDFTFPSTLKRVQFRSTQLSLSSRKVSVLAKNNIAVGV